MILTHSYFISCEFSVTFAHAVPRSTAKIYLGDPQHSGRCQLTLNNGVVRSHLAGTYYMKQKVTENPRTRVKYHKISTYLCLQVLFLTCVASTAGASDEELDKKLKPSPVAEPSHTTTPVLNNEFNKDDKDVSILKQINKVNDDGSYTYGYEASDGSFKVETRDVAGNVKGMFGFVDETGRLKRVSYSASNSSGFQAAGSTSPPIDSTSGPVPSSSSPSPSLQSIQTIPPRKNKDDVIEQDVEKSTVGVKKVLVSKRPISVQPPEQDEMTRRREGNDLRRQLPRNDDDDAPDVYGVHDRSSLQSAPVSPVVSALMSELDPIRAYRPMAPSARQVAYDKLTTPPATTYDTSVSSFDQQNTISRQAQNDEESPQYRSIPVQYRQRSTTAAYQQSVYEQPTYPVLQSEPSVYQQQPQIVYGPNLVALRDELMELILSFVQARVSQIMSFASYRHQPVPQPYPMPYQQPNYYVPSYYQGPRIPAPTPLAIKQQDDYITQQSSPRVTQTLKNGLIRMLLSTSPRYDPEKISERSTPRLTYRRTTQSTPVRNVQIIGDDNSNGARPVTTETPD